MKAPSGIARATSTRTLEKLPYSLMTTQDGKRAGSPPRVFGHARVSSKEQHERRQIDALRAAGVGPRDIFLDKQSGKDFKRPAYQRLLRKLKAGDVLYLVSIDRLGRNYDEILEQWRSLTKEKDIDIAVLDMPLLDTRHEKNLIGTFIADLVLQILSFVAHSERENIRARQAQGICAAKARGVRFGRPTKPVPDGFHEAARRYGAGETTLSGAARLCGMPLSSFRNKYLQCSRMPALSKR